MFIKDYVFYDIQSWVYYCSYKEQSEHSTDSDEVLENEDEDDAAADGPDVDSIERVMTHRVGRKGGTNIDFWKAHWPSG